MSNKNQDVEPRLMNCKAAALYLCMSQGALRKNIYLKRFNKALVRIGGRIYFDKKKLDLLIEDLKEYEDGL